MDLSESRLQILWHQIHRENNLVWATSIYWLSVVDITSMDSVILLALVGIFCAHKKWYVQFFFCLLFRSRWKPGPVFSPSPAWSWLVGGCDATEPWAGGSPSLYRAGESLRRWVSPTYWPLLGSSPNNLLRNRAVLPSIFWLSTCQPRWRRNAKDIHAIANRCRSLIRELSQALPTMSSLMS